MTEIEVETSTVIQTFESPIYAEWALGVLEDHQIPCRLDNLHTGAAHPGLGTALGDIQLVVPTEHAEQAVSVLSDLQNYGGEFIDEEERALFEKGDDQEDRPLSPDLTCPECFRLEIGFAGWVTWYWIAVAGLFVAMIVVADIAGPGTPPAMVGVGLFTATSSIGILLLITKSFPLQCKHCGYRSRRNDFYLRGE